jgi:hypothetical protein
MGRLFRHYEGNWEAHPLESGASMLLLDGNGNLIRGAAPEAWSHPGWRVRIGTFVIAGAATDVLLLRPGVTARLNGHPVVGELAILQDRSVLSIGPQRFFYSSETPAKVETFHPGAPRIFCARCNDEVTNGDIVQCPGCRTVFHQSQDRPCFTYSEHCPHCNAPTALDEEGWTPAML